MMKLTPCAALVLLSATLALAEEVDCTTAQVQVELTWCAEQGWMAADAELNAVYAEARARTQQIDTDLPQDEQGAERYLKDAQRAWVTFRDAACAAEGYLFHGGSAEPMLIYGCREQLTRARISDLERLLERN